LHPRDSRPSYGKKLAEPRIIEPNLVQPGRFRPRPIQSGGSLLFEATAFHGFAPFFFLGVQVQVGGVEAGVAGVALHEESWRQIHFLLQQPGGLRKNL